MAEYDLLLKGKLAEQPPSWVTDIQEKMRKRRRNGMVGLGVGSILAILVAVGLPQVSPTIGKSGVWLGIPIFMFVVLIFNKPPVYANELLAVYTFNVSAALARLRSLELQVRSVRPENQTELARLKSARDSSIEECRSTLAALDERLSQITPYRSPFTGGIQRFVKTVLMILQKTYCAISMESLPTELLLGVSENLLGLATLFSKTNDLGEEHIKYTNALQQKLDGVEPLRIRVSWVERSALFLIGKFKHPRVQILAATLISVVATFGILTTCHIDAYRSFTSSIVVGTLVFGVVKWLREPAPR